MRKNEINFPSCCCLWQNQMYMQIFHSPYFTITNEKLPRTTNARIVPKPNVPKLLNHHPVARVLTLHSFLPCLLLHWLVLAFIGPVLLLLCLNLDEDHKTRRVFASQKICMWRYILLARGECIIISLSFHIFVLFEEKKRMRGTRTSSYSHSTHDEKNFFKY